MELFLSKVSWKDGRALLAILGSYNVPLGDASLQTTIGEEPNCGRAIAAAKEELDVPELIESAGES